MISIRFVRFILVGIVNTIFGYSLYVLLIFLGFRYNLAILIATILGVLFNFKTTGILVFNSRRNYLILRYCGAYAIIYFLNVVSVWLLLKAGSNPYLAQALVTPAIAVSSYAIQRNLVFRADNGDKAPAKPNVVD
jgi:putative flippase GtrA